MCSMRARPISYWSKPACWFREAEPRPVVARHKVAQLIARLARSRFEDNHKPRSGAAIYLVVTAIFSRITSLLGQGPSE